MSLSYILFMHVCLAALERHHALAERNERIGDLSQLDLHMKNLYLCSAVTTKIVLAKLWLISFYLYLYIRENPET